MDSNLASATAEEFLALIREDCTPNRFGAGGAEGIVRFVDKSLTDDSVAELVKALEIKSSETADDELFPDDTLRPLTSLFLHNNDLGDAALTHLARVIGKLEALENLTLFGNTKVTTLAPLTGAGELRNLKVLNVGCCSLEGDCLPRELCTNLVALSCLYLFQNDSAGGIVLTAEALCALPAECRVVMRSSLVQVSLWRGEELVALPTGDGEEFGEPLPTQARTVEDICHFVGVDRVTLIKPARSAPRGEGVADGAFSHAPPDQITKDE